MGLRSLIVAEGRAGRTRKEGSERFYGDEEERGKSEEYRER